jgi:glycosyltransferase involved in cell wall biosynthesis
MSKDTAREKLLKKYNLPTDSIIAVTCGRFVEQKGHRYLVEAAPEIVLKYPNIYFLFLGDGPVRDKLESKINALDIKKHFILAGMTNNVAEILFGCDLMIHPSIEEPFGIAILEAMRAGLPVIASKVGGIPEVVKENETGMLVEPKNISALYSAVNANLQSPLKMTQMGEAGRKRWTSHFSFEVMIDRVETYLKGHLTRENTYGKAQADRA